MEKILRFKVVIELATLLANVRKLRMKHREEENCQAEKAMEEPTLLKFPTGLPSGD